MASSEIQVHGYNTTGTSPNIYAEVETNFSGFSGTTPLYTVTVTLKALRGYSYFGYDLWVMINGDDRMIKGNYPSQWGDDQFSETFYNVPYGSQATMSSTNCGCGEWGTDPGIPYDYQPYTPPGTINNLKINNSSSINVLNKSDTFNLSWSAPSGGTGGISGYHVYYKTNGNYIHIGDTSGTSFSTKIASINNSISRGTTLTFMVKAYNSSSEGGNSNTVTCKFIAPTISVSASNTTANSTKINWTSNILMKKVEWKFSNESSYKTYYSGNAVSSGNIQISGLNYNTPYTIQVRLTGNESSEVFNYNTTVTTLDIARIRQWETEWSVEDSTNLTISNPSNLAMQLYISYNNIELISRSNITLNNGVYTLTLTESEKNILYTQTATDNNPSFKFILKSYSGSSKLGEDVKATKITFPTKAWVKVSGVWKKALVWTKVGNAWKQSIPWVKIGTTWKRI